MAEQRYRAVLAVIADGRTVKEVAGQYAVSRQMLHAWLGRYEVAGLEGLSDRSHRPQSCPHRMPAAVEVAVLELRRAHPYWGPRRIVYELGRRRLTALGLALPSQSAVYRCLVRAGLIEVEGRQRRERKWKRWERGTPMELWQMDMVGGFALADGSTAKALTGVDDHSRVCVCARLMPKERTQAVCDGLAAAMRTHGVPEQILTDNGKVFTGRFNSPPTEVLFDRICRENGIEHLLTQPRTPTTTGKIERFHRTLRAEFDTRQVFASLALAQQALDEWVTYYNTVRPHSSTQMTPPQVRFSDPRPRPPTQPDATLPTQSARSPRPVKVSVEAAQPQRTGDQWVSRRVGANGVVCVNWQQVSVGKHRAGARCDVLVSAETYQFWVGTDLLKTVTRNNPGEVRKKHASVQQAEA